MCNQVQSVTLQTAILMQVKEFAQNNQQFSIHDITRIIREKTTQGELEIPEVEVTGASFRFDIQHAKVKVLFDELWNTGVFDPDFILSRKFNGVYFDYTPASVSKSDPYDDAPVTPSSTAPVPTPTTSVTYGPLPSDSLDRITTYLANCHNRNFRPTLKQIQSAIKRADISTGISCDELKSCVVNVLGYTIIDDPDAISRSQVVTV